MKKKKTQKTSKPVSCRRSVDNIQPKTYCISADGTVKFLKRRG